MPKFYDDSDEDSEETGQVQQDENASFKELREHAKALEKQTKQQAKELEDLRSYRNQAEVAGKLARAQSFGLSESQAKLFLKTNEGDVTPEAVQGFRQEMGLEPVPESESPVTPSPGDYPTPQWSTPGFSPVSAGGSYPVKASITYEQYKDLLNKDPRAAFRAIAEGRVEGLSAAPDPANPDGAVARY